MGSLDFSGLGDLSRKNPERVTAGHQPLTLNDLGYGSVLAFDQSLTATGCLILIRDLDGIRVYSATQWPDTYMGSDVATSLARGVAVYEQARAVIGFNYMPLDAVVHESPPNPKAVKGGGYSSLLAAQALRCAAHSEGVEMEMLGAQPAKKLVCGNPNAAKTEVHAVLRTQVLPWIGGSEKVTNGATRDALLIGLLWLSRRKKT